MTSTTGQAIVTALQALHPGAQPDQASWDAIGTVLDSLIAPSGSIKMYGNVTPPTGWLICDGSLVSRTTYANLFAVIGTTFNTGGGGETPLNFRLPDFGGIFPRGAGTSGQLSNANGTAFSGVLGTYQNDKFQGHYHEFFGALNVSPGGGSQDTAEPNTNLGQQVRLPTADPSNGAPRYGTETNPANLSVYFIIKY